jgi:hypothetical protein
MENPTPHDQDESRSMSEKSGSEHDLTKQVSNSSTTQRNGHMHDSTPTATRGEQSIGTPAMPPPPRPNFKTTPNSAQPSNHSQRDSTQELLAASTEKKHGSGRQRTMSSKDSSQEPTKPITRKRSHEENDRRQVVEEVDDGDDDDEDEDATDEFNEPANAISPFDWENLQQRYHDQMRHCGEQEQDLYREFSRLCNVSFLSRVKYQVTDNLSTSTSGPTLDPSTRRIVASSGMHIHATSTTAEC